MEKPNAPSCERNRAPILEVLHAHFHDRRAVLEIGSGTGQHAIHFAAALPHLVWQASDRAENLPGIAAWLAEAQLPNTPPALELDVLETWPVGRFDAAFSANTLHIMPWAAVERLFAALPTVLEAGACFIVYGPFNYQGRYTSDSNAAFDVWLKERGAHQGIRDFERVQALAGAADLQLVDDVAMPSNNRCLIWRYAASRMAP